MPRSDMPIDVDDLKHLYKIHHMKERFQREGYGVHRSFRAALMPRRAIMPRVERNLVPSEIEAVAIDFHYIEFTVPGTEIRCYAVHAAGHLIDLAPVENRAWKRC